MSDGAEDRPEGLGRAPIRPAFRLPGGESVPAVTAGEMREIDRIAVEETGPSILQMMENAGRSLAEVVVSMLGPAHGRARVAVVAGTGGNGGGGACAARHLLPRTGEVALGLVGRGSPSGALAVQRSIFESGGGRPQRWEQLPDPRDFDVVVDALLGYALDGPPRGEARAAIDWLNRAALVVSLDLPSGLPPDGDAPPGAVVRAARTLTLHLPKPGLRDALAGDLLLADLGIPREANARLGIVAPSYGSGFVVPIARDPLLDPRRNP